MDGRAFRRELERDRRFAKIPLVIVSGSREAEGVARTLRAVAVLPKPFGVEKLLASIKTATEH